MNQLNINKDSIIKSNMFSVNEGQLRSAFKKYSEAQDASEYSMPPEGNPLKRRDKL